MSELEMVSMSELEEWSPTATYKRAVGPCPGGATLEVMRQGL